MLKVGPGAHYATQHHASKNLSGSWWQVQFVWGLWWVVDLQWSTRCNALHDVKVGLSAKEVETQICRYYRNPHLYVTNEDIGLFCLPLRDRLAQSHQSQDLWPWAVVVAVVEAARKQEEGDALVGISDIC